MDEIDAKQQEEIEHHKTELRDLQSEDIRHWKELIELGKKTLYIQRSFAVVFIWLIILSILVFVLRFNDFALEVKLGPTG